MFSLLLFLVQLALSVRRDQLRSRKREYMLYHHSNILYTVAVDKNVQ